MALLPYWRNSLGQRSPVLKLQTQVVEVLGEITMFFSISIQKMEGGGESHRNVHKTGSELYQRGGGQMAPSSMIQGEGIKKER